MSWRASHREQGREGGEGASAAVIFQSHPIYPSVDRLASTLVWLVWIGDLHRILSHLSQFTWDLDHRLNLKRPRQTKSTTPSQSTHLINLAITLLLKGIDPITLLWSPSRSAFIYNSQHRSSIIDNSPRQILIDNNRTANFRLKCEFSISARETHMNILLGVKVRNTHLFLSRSPLSPPSTVVPLDVRLSFNLADQTRRLLI